MSKEILLGHIAVDSGQLMICDPCYIDSEWIQEDFEDIRVYKNKETGKTLTYGKDFTNYETKLPEYEGKTMNELLYKVGGWEQIKSSKAKHGFSYNACAKATLSSEGFGVLNFKAGHGGAGIAFGTAYGDGLYPVFGTYDSDGVIQSVTVKF